MLAERIQSENQFFTLVKIIKTFVQKCEVLFTRTSLENILGEISLTRKFSPFAWKGEQYWDVIDIEIIVFQPEAVNESLIDRIKF